MAGDEVRGEKKRRRAERNTVRGDVILHAPGGAALAHVRDVSTRGAGLASPNPPDVGARVHLEFPALLGRPTVDGVVRHASRRSQQVGVEFDHPCETAAKVTEELVKSRVSGEDL